MSRARKSPPPALSGLIRQLPAGAWSTHSRALFLEAFTRCLDLSIPLNDGLVVPESEAHADDPQDGPDLITFRSTGRGAHEVIENRAEGPGRVLAMVQFTEGVRGWRGAMERLTAHLASVSQDGVQ